MLPVDLHVEIYMYYMYTPNYAKARTNCQCPGNGPQYEGTVTGYHTLSEASWLARRPLCALGLIPK